MATSVIIEEQLEIPLSIRSLLDFRRWATSDEFPEQGRIDYIAGRIEVDMSPEDLFCHGTLKIEMITVLNGRAKHLQLGDLFSDRTRVSCPDADLSAEPDIVFVAADAVVGGRVRLIAKATAGPGRYIELEGSPDLVVEIVSDSSVNKDTDRLPQAYWSAGIREFWLVDARGDQLVFEIRRAGECGFEAVPVDEHGYQHSAVFGCRYRLDRSRDGRGLWTYNLCEKA